MYSLLNYLILFFTVVFKLISAQSSANMTESGQINRLVFDRVATSPAFISKVEFVEAWNAALPFLPNANITPSYIDVGQYPHFINTAVGIGKINNTTQLAMYFAQMLYETNGFSINKVLPCSKFGSAKACSDYNKINVNNTAPYSKNQYYGRGNLFIENVGSYTAASKFLYGNDMLYRKPGLITKFHQNPVTWATSAWTWHTKVGSLIGSSDAFGLTTRFLRPGDCESKTEMSSNAETAFKIYEAVLSVFDPDRVANPAGCTQS